MDEEGGTVVVEEEPAAVGASADGSGPAAAPDGSAEPEEEAPAPAPAPAPSVPAPEPTRPPPLKEYLDEHAPESLVCPISLHLLEDPVILAGDGCTYSRAAIEAHLAHCRARELGWLVG